MYLYTVNIDFYFISAGKEFQLELFLTCIISFLPYNLFRVLSIQRDICEVISAQLARSARHKQTTELNK